MSHNGHQKDITEYLESWSKLDRYSDWIYHQYEGYIGKKVLDIGGGIGTAIKHYIDRVDQIIATELFSKDVDIMNRRFAGVPYFSAIRFDIMKDDITILCDYAPDTIICINCLEHIEDDVKALSIMADIIRGKGYVVICVPAMSWLYCYMDRNVGHYRRYKRGELKKRQRLLGLGLKRIII